MSDLTSREHEILKFISEQINKNGFPPTVRDICAALKISSTSTVHKAMCNLEKEGYIEKLEGKRRAFRIVNFEPEVKNVSVVPEQVRADVVDIPVIGRVAAGTPILAEQNIEDSFPLPARYASNGTNFMLKVHGESMIEIGIYDGDYILVHQQNTASNGDVVVAMIDGLYDSEATVKTFYKEDGHIRLQPENSGMKPIIVPDCQIIGLVKGVFRYFN